jgi:CRP-like cAMP-binding protein
MKLSEKIGSIFRRAEENTPEGKLHYLSVTDIFCDLEQNELMEIAHAATMVTCPAGKIFYSPNERGEVLFILKKGHVQIYRLSDEGRKLVMATLGPGTVFGELALTGIGMHDGFAEATDDAVICILNRRDVEKVLLSKPQVAVRMLDLLGKRLRTAEERLEQTLFHDVPSRLAALLLRLHEDTGSNVIDMTHEHLAEHLGVYRETVTGALNNLRKENLISIARKQVELIDVPGLQRKSSQR